MPTPKVLFVGPDNSKGGIGAVLNVYSRNLSNFELITTFSSDLNKNRVVYFIKSLFRLIKKLLNDASINIVHIHTASNGSFLRKSIVLLITKTLSRKVVLHIHGGSFKEYLSSSTIRAQYIIAILTMADVVVCLSDEWLIYFKTNIGLNNAVVLSNPIELPILSNRQKEEDKIELLFLGAVVPPKGIFDLIEYLATNEYFISGRIRLHICGEGDQYQLDKVLQKHNISDAVVQHGWVQNDLKSSLMNMMDVFILPSYIEALPMSILEAMSYGKPIVSTRVGGIPSLVKEDYNGWLYDPNDIKHLDKIIDEIFADKGRIKAYGHNSRAEALKYDIQTVAKKLNSIYDSALNYN
jgi:glycosyltransferase involved in cell wall biosynthesis